MNSLTYPLSLKSIVSLKSELKEGEIWHFYSWLFLLTIYMQVSKVDPISNLFSVSHFYFVLTVTSRSLGKHAPPLIDISPLLKGTVLRKIRFILEKKWNIVNVIDNVKLGHIIESNCILI